MLVWCNSNKLLKFKLKNNKKKAVQIWFYCSASLLIFGLEYFQYFMVSFRFVHVSIVLFHAIELKTKLHVAGDELYTNN